MSPIKEAIEARSLYEVTGDIKDINTMLINRAELAALRSMPAEPVGEVVFTATPFGGYNGVKFSEGWLDAATAGAKLCTTPPPAPVLSDAEILRAAVAAMPHTNPGVADDLIAGFTMHTEAEDIIAIWHAASGRASRGAK